MQQHHYFCSFSEHINPLFINSNTANIALRQKGFSLIELLIAIAIVAVLGSIAQPIYSDYIVRAKMTEPQQIADNLSSRITQCITIDSVDYDQCNTFAKLNVEEDDFLTDIVEGIAISSSTPSFSIDLQNTGNAQLNDASLNFSFENSDALLISWQCEIDNSDLNHLVSRQCRAN